MRRAVRWAVAAILGGPAVRGAVGGSSCRPIATRSGTAGLRDAPLLARPSLEMGLGEVVVLLMDWYALSQHAHEPIVGVVVDVGDATAGEHLEVVTDEPALQRHIGLG